MVSSNEVIELTARLMECEQQRNNALNQAVLLTGQLAIAGKTIGDRDKEIEVLKEKINSRESPPAETVVETDGR